MPSRPTSRLILRRLVSGAYELATIDGDTIFRGPLLLCRELASRLTVSRPVERVAHYAPPLAA